MRYPIPRVGATGNAKKWIGLHCQGKHMPPMTWGRSAIDNKALGASVRLTGHIQEAILDWRGTSVSSKS